MLAILVNGGGAVVLFGARVEQVDTAGLQLLVVFARELQESGRPWDWDGISPALRKAATRLGLLEVLRMGPDAPAHAREARQ